jgi:hypothetical protein
MKWRQDLPVGYKRMVGLLLCGAAADEGGVNPVSPLLAMPLTACGVTIPLQAGKISETKKPTSSVVDYIVHIILAYAPIYLVTASFMQPDGKVGIYGSNNILRGGIRSIMCTLLILCVRRRSVILTVILSMRRAYLTNHSPSWTSFKMTKIWRG